MKLKSVEIAIYLTLEFNSSRGNKRIKNKKKLKDEKNKYLKVRCDFSLKVVDKTLINIFEDFLNLTNL